MPGCSVLPPARRIGLFSLICAGILCSSCVRDDNNLPSTDKLGFWDIEPVASSDISPDSLYTLLPWSDWDLPWYRPQTAKRSFYLNSAGDTVRCLSAVFPNEYLAFGLFSKYRMGFLSNQNYGFSGNTAVIYHKNVVVT